jgi:hypothetical protein
MCLTMPSEAMSLQTLSTTRLVCFHTLFNYQPGRRRLTILSIASTSCIDKKRGGNMDSLDVVVISPNQVQRTLTLALGAGNQTLSQLFNP